jgi:hypothetical protein
MVGAYLHMAQTSPNVYFFVTAIGRDPLSLAEAAAGADAAGAEPLDDFFADITAMMGESMRAYIGAGGAASGSAAHAALSLWPRASIGMVRAAGESWLRLPPDAGRPSEAELTDAITEWLVAGISTTAARHRTPPPDNAQSPPRAAGAPPTPPTHAATSPDERHLT